MQFVLAESRNTSSHTPVLSESGGQTATLSAEVRICSMFHLMDESFPCEKETTLLIRRLVEASATPKRAITVDVEAACPSAVGTAPPLDVVAEDRPLEIMEVAMERDIPGAAKAGSSSAGGRRKMVIVEDDGSGSDIDPEDVRAFEERFTRVEVRTERSTRNTAIHLCFNLLVNSECLFLALAPLCAESENRTLQTLKDANLSLAIFGMALQTLILEIESTLRKEKRTTLYIRWSQNTESDVLNTWPWFACLVRMLCSQLSVMI
uniref:Uncharacterized protein LOC104213453 n=1 Tax=Nicotiana sylvestris TaxID=4096 RepID=A0A1U7UZ15_NICSY|nr:PREDICTED: uncharacterized protein LOC104213453 [Nicotiana sylvestris]